MISRKIRDLKGPSFLLVRRWSSLPEYTETPEYPPILDLSRNGRNLRALEERADELKRIPTVEEKLMKVNMPRYYGWQCFGLDEMEIPYGSREFAQYATRTFCFNEPGLPEFFNTSGLMMKSELIFEQIKDHIKEAIVLEHVTQRNSVDDADKQELGERIVQQINSVILSFLMKDYPHLLDCQVQHFPRLESFWSIGGIHARERWEKYREKYVKDDVGKPVNVKLQYFGKPIIQLRHEFPLLPIVDREEAQNWTGNVPEFKFNPKTLRLRTSYRHVTNIPGFWPGDVAEYPLMSFHSTKHLKERTYNDNHDVLYVQAALASYAWLQAVATYQGFSTYQDVTYPLVTQTVLSNGQDWSFFIYQLNTTLFHSHYIDQNNLCNLLWGTEKAQLYEAVENGSVVGFNDEVLKSLLCFYLNVPQQREGVNMKPYLGTDTKHIADITDDEKRVWLEQRFKHMFSNRPRHLLADEVYSWEKIYKIDHNTRPMDARRRPFELGEKPFRRRYDDHTPQYIPKAFRKHKRDKWEKTYYP